MNLTSLRQKIKNITDYSPELQQFDDQIDQLINDAFYEVWTHKRWNFATKQEDFFFYPDITPGRDNENASGGNDVNANVLQGSRQVTFNAIIGRLNNKDRWEGCPISIQNIDYTISKIVNGTTILLDREFEGDSKADDVSWRIKKRFYDLPQDCLELLFIGHRDTPYNSVGGTQTPYGKATALLPAKEEDYQLRMDYAMGYAEAYIPSPTINIPPGEDIGIDNAEGEGTLDNGYHEYCWAFVKDGKVGPLSKPQVHHTAGNSTKITISFVGFDDRVIQSSGYQANDKVPSDWEGYRKVIFWNKNLDHHSGERKGLPCWVALIKGGPTRDTATYLTPVVVEDTQGTYDVTYENQHNNAAPRYIERDGSHQQIRPYPRVDGWDVEIPQEKSGEFITQFRDYWRGGIIRYYKKPQDLLCATDSPEMPYEFHQLIVYKALETIYLKMGMSSMAQTYERKYDKDIKDLEKRYVDKADFRPQRGQFGFSRNFRGYDASMLRHGG